MTQKQIWQEVQRAAHDAEPDNSARHDADVPEEAIAQILDTINENEKALRFLARV